MDIKLPGIDLNLRHYVGERSDVLKKVQLKIENYLRDPNVDMATRKIYSAIYNSISYYQTISDLSISGEYANNTFLEDIIKDVNEDYKYLAEKYNTPDHQTISIKGRIKSPVSALDKILEKVGEYIHDGRDLSKLNDSLRDFIGIRVIVDAPQEIKDQGKKAESDFCYQVFQDLIEFRGIKRQVENGEPQGTDYQFIPVNTEHDPNKLKKMKDPNRTFDFDPEKEGIYIPDSRPENLENYDEYFKDYRMYPKPKLYQRIHICAHPYFSKNVPQKMLPNYIIPPKSNNPAIEYQISTADEDYWAEHGKAAHHIYKDKLFHRLSIPLQFSFDKVLNKIRLRRLDESMESFYGFSFKSFFNIDYQDFLRIFNTEQRDEILANRQNVVYDEENKEYTLKEILQPVVVPEDIDGKYVKEHLSEATPEDLRKFFNENNLLDNSINPDGTIYKPSIQVCVHKRPAAKQRKLSPMRLSKRNIIKRILHIKKNKDLDDSSSQATSLGEDEAPRNQQIPEDDGEHEH